MIRYHITTWQLWADLHIRYKDVIVAPLVVIAIPSITVPYEVWRTFTCSTIGQASKSTIQRLSVDHVWSKGLVCDFIYCLCKAYINLFKFEMLNLCGGVKLSWERQKSTEGAKFSWRGVQYLAGRSQILTVEFWGWSAVKYCNLG